MIAALGSFWSRVYEGSDQIESYTTGTGNIANQTYQNLLETVASISRYDVPLFHTENITPIVLRRTDQNNINTTNELFDSNNVAFDAGLLFDTTAETQFFSFPLPAKFVDVMQLFNRITFPTAALVKNVDFVIDRRRNAIVFRENPFNNSLLVRRPIKDSQVPDEEITLWGFRGQFDYDFVFEQFAYAVGLQLATSQGYKDLTNAIISGLITGGATAAILDAAISAICGVPTSVDATETVEAIETDVNGLFIATDKNVYRFHERAIPLVEVEQTIRAGTQLVHAVEITEFSVGNAYIPGNDQQRVICCPSPDKLLATNIWDEITTENDENILVNQSPEECRARRAVVALAIESGFLASCFYSNLVFENRVVPLEVDINHPSGYTYVKFKLGGLPADVEQFFDEVHRRGIVAAQTPKDQCHPGRKIGTLAHLLDRRVNPSGEPTAINLPRNINPLRFLIENVLRNNVFVVRILLSTLGQNRLGMYNIRHLRQLLPPQTAMIVVFELDADADSIAPEQISENISTFTGAEPLTDSVPVSLVQDMGATVRLISGTCQ